jgi:hypothetical protein
VSTFSKWLQNTFRNYGQSLSKAVKSKLLEEFLSDARPIGCQHELIRLGGTGDGGYLIPNDLTEIVACFSPGVFDVSDFEFEMAKRGIPCFLADASVEKPPIQNDAFDFEKKFLGIKEEGNYITLESWVERKAPKIGDMILQMDIEGAEFDVLIDTSNDILMRFRIIVIEFHGLDAIFSKGGFNLINLVFKKLLKNFEIVHIHPNNCCGVTKMGKIEIPNTLEVTFFRKDRISEKYFRNDFPHPLDKRNLTDRADIILPKCWYTK